MSSTKKLSPRLRKIFILLILIFILFVILVYSVSNTIKQDRDLPSLLTTKKDLAVRGNIYSNDNFKIGTSRKIYSASIDTRSLDKNKKELFITLFSIYSNIDKKIIRKKIKKKNGHLIISRNIDQRIAKELKSLAYKLNRLKVFKRIKINGSSRLYGLDIVEAGEKRLYPYKDAMTPVIGYMKKKNSKSGKQRVYGEKGIEAQFNKELNNMTDGVLKGEKDILSYILFNTESDTIKREDGKDLRLTIPLKLQRNIELMLDRYKIKLECKEIIVSVMESSTGKILTLASSNRYNPSRIKENEIKNINVNAIEYQYEPGSVIKPIALALAIDNNKIKKR